MYEKAQESSPRREAFRRNVLGAVAVLTAVLVLAGVAVAAYHARAGRGDELATAGTGAAPTPIASVAAAPEPAEKAGDQGRTGAGADASQDTSGPSQGGDAPDGPQDGDPQDGGGVQGGDPAAPDDPDDPDDPEPGVIPVDPAVIMPLVRPTVHSVSTASCTEPFTVTGTIEVTAADAWYPMTVEYHWQRNDGYIGHVESVEVDGNAAIPVSAQWLSSGPGWVALQVTSPYGTVVSEQVPFEECVMVLH